MQFCKVFFVCTLFQVIFEATRGSGYLGDIALDDISMADGPCSVQGKDKTTIGIQHLFGMFF